MKNTKLQIDSLTEMMRSFGQKGIEFWLSGGWGIDALLGKITRNHSDIDIVIEVNHRNDLIQFIEREDSNLRITRITESNIKLLDQQRDVLIDVVFIKKVSESHYIFDPDSSLEFVIPIKVEYLPSIFNGTIEDLAIKAITWEGQYLIKSRYQQLLGESLRDKDKSSLKIIEQQLSVLALKKVYRESDLVAKSLIKSFSHP